MNWLIWVFSAVAGSVFYQILAKIFAGRLPLPVYMTLVSGTVFAISLVTLMATEKTAYAQIAQDKKLLLLPIGIGVATFMIDLSFYYLYKNNAPLSLARMIILAAIAIILLFVGIVFFKEKFDFHQIIGACLCLAGLYFIVMWKPKT